MTNIQHVSGFLFGIYITISFTFRLNTLWGKDQVFTVLAQQYALTGYEPG